MAKAEPDRSDHDAAQREARALLAQMRSDLEKLTEFLDGEQASLRRRPPSAKRVARLRLIAQDLASARGFSRRKPKV